MSNNSISKTFIVATLLCVVCSVMVSGAAVFLKPAQERNKALDKKKNILAAAGLYKDESQNIDELFKKVETRLVDLATGTYVSDINATSFDAYAAAKDPKLQVMLTREQDKAGVKRIAKYAPVYLVQEGGIVQTIILPIHGKGLWSTLYGFIALATDTNTVKGLVFYEHGETPGLGGEVDNPLWKAIWPGKTVFDDSWNPVVQILKGAVNPQDAGAIHQVDGLSGATLTSRGIEGLLRFWLGETGFGPYLTKLRQEGGSNG
ncbi:MAG: Na(+)-translocating NADH-quinone reductase subunit C [SAR324 cluster bacterium]|nr:Na(+)-translocating NADH-quinone reductase subunit C [SAR324 cluster bacterium]